MDGIVSLLDDKHYSLIEHIWDEFENRFGMVDIAPTPIAHYSYQIAHHYDLETLIPALNRVAQKTEPFIVKTSGLGIFTGEQPVLYVPVVRTPQLA